MGSWQSVKKWEIYHQADPFTFVSFDSNHHIVLPCPSFPPLPVESWPTCPIIKLGRSLFSIPTSMIPWGETLIIRKDKSQRGVCRAAPYEICRTLKEIIEIGQDLFFFIYSFLSEMDFQMSLTVNMFCLIHMLISNLKNVMTFSQPIRLSLTHFRWLWFGRRIKCVSPSFIH